MINSNAIDTILAIFLPFIRTHRVQASTPFVLGLSGLQGSGKSAWAVALSQALTVRHNLKTRAISLDDLYYDHLELRGLREANINNPLLQTRGLPGTHDEGLAKEFFSQVLGRTESRVGHIMWPAYDKSLHQGQGGRVPVDEWEEVALGRDLEVLIFEGWALGFEPLTQEEVTTRWEQAKAADGQRSQEPFVVTTLADHKLSHLLLMNENLGRYCELFTGPQHYDGFLQLSTDNLVYVYDWRLSQEQGMRKHKLGGMTDEQVVKFVKGYMPAYELFLERLQNRNLFKDNGKGVREKKHIQVVLNKDRDVMQIREA